MQESFIKTVDGKEIPKEGRTLKSTEDFENCQLNSQNIEQLLCFVDDEAKGERRGQIMKEIMCQAKEFQFGSVDIEGL